MSRLRSFLVPLALCCALVSCYDTWGALENPYDSRNALVAPEYFSATAWDQEILLAWNAVPYATSYKVYWKEGSNVDTSSGSSLVSSGTTAVITGLTNDLSYAVMVVPMNATGEGPPSQVRVVTPYKTTSPPSAPSWKAISSGNGQVTLTWDSVLGATGYNLYFEPGLSASTSSPKHNPIPMTGITVNVSGLTNGTTYAFVLTAVNAYGESSTSSTMLVTPTAVATPAPEAPTGLAATPENGGAALSWESVHGATGYYVYFAPGEIASKTSSRYNATAVTGTEANVSGLTNGIEYAFVVTAVNANGESSESAIVTTTPYGAPDAPTGLSAVASNGQVELLWSAASYATSYRVYYAAGSNVSLSSTAYGDNPIVGTSAVIDGLVNGTTYSFLVIAANDKGDSPATSTISASTPSGVDVEITPPPVVELSITLPSIPASISRSATLIVDAVVSGSPTSIQWYRNGTALAGQISAELNLPLEGSAPGIYQFTVIAIKPGAIASADFNITLE